MTRGTPATPRWQGLDGLRALAVTAVVIYHFSPDPTSTLPGGFLGVDVFFVISGYLITRLLAEEFLTTGRVDAPRFYQRRARRLLPALAVLLGAVSASALIWRDQLSTVRGGVLATAVFGANWWLALDHHSYFVSTGRPSMLQHLWSLGVEEQFYLIWPVVVASTLAAGRRARARGRRTGRTIVTRLSILAAVLSVASTALTWWLADARNVPYGSDGSFLYYGTDTHCMGLLLGASLGAWAARGRSGDPAAGLAVVGERFRASADWFRGAVDACGVTALALLIWMMLGVASYSHSLYRGDFLALSALVVVVIAVATQPGSRVGRVLDLPLFRWVGVRSYSIYLWHWPVAIVTRPGIDTTMPVWLDQVLRVAITLVLSDLTYRFVETPIRQRGFTATLQGVLASVHTAGRQGGRRLAGPRGGLALSAVIAVVMLVGAFVIIIGPAAPTPSAALGSSPGGQHLSLGGPKPSPSPSPPVDIGDKTPPPKLIRLPKISGFGDSVLLGARRALGEVFPGGSIDAIEGRQPDPILEDIRKDARAGTLKPLVIIHVGNNGLIEPDDLQRTLATLSGARLVLVLNDHVDSAGDRAWQKPNNATIGSVVPRYPNARVIDWSSIVSRHKNWLYGDDLHLTPTGALGYAKLLATTYRADIASVSE